MIDSEEITTDISSMDVTEQSLIHTVYSVSVASMAIIMYIYIGCMTDWNEFRNNLRRPIGPGIAVFAQFFIKPTVSLFTACILLQRKVRVAQMEFNLSI